MNDIYNSPPLCGIVFAYKDISFLIDTVDLARILGNFLDNAIEATLETEQPQIGLNIIQNKTGVSIIIIIFAESRLLISNTLMLLSWFSL